MEFTFASDRTANAYFDRIVQTAAEVELREIIFCLNSCKVAHRAHLNPEINLSQRLCLQDCTQAISLDLSRGLDGEQFK